MTSLPKATRQTIVVEDAVFDFSIDRCDAPQTISVEVFLDGKRMRGWEEPGWREIGIGVRSGLLYWWSARRLVAVDSVSQSVRFEIVTNEDILCCFLVDEGWLLVLETSVELRSETVAHASRRVELDEVVAAFQCSGNGLVLDLVGGAQHLLEVTSDGFAFKS